MFQTWEVIIISIVMIVIGMTVQFFVHRIKLKAYQSKIDNEEPFDRPIDPDIHKEQMKELKEFQNWPTFSSKCIGTHLLDESSLSPREKADKKNKQRIDMEACLSAKVCPLCGKDIDKKEVAVYVEGEPGHVHTEGHYALACTSCKVRRFMYQHTM